LPKHKIRHTIETTGRLVFAKARRLDLDKLRQAETEFLKLEAAGIIRRCSGHRPCTWSARKMGNGVPAAITADSTW
jgi:hypothetical protein